MYLIESSIDTILLNKTTLLLLHHTYRQHFGPIIDIVLKDIDQQLELEKPDEKHLLTAMSTLALITTVRKASRIEGKAMKHSEENEKSWC